MDSPSESPLPPELSVKPARQSLDFNPLKVSPSNAESESGAASLTELGSGDKGPNSKTGEAS